ncbi:hypothetical protein [Lacinutrix jangbogonensis]|uniref:hypothetical protein n=1 Tax=Lacinutrix jangbogonensis TaxID=1469557 RepID=UPI00053E160C|nr:hypothetical protein [Lacinutrix jangbogonensis]
MKAKINLRIDLLLKGELETLALERETTVSNLIRDILEEKVSDYFEEQCVQDFEKPEPLVIDLSDCLGQRTEEHINQLNSVHYFPNYIDLSQCLNVKPNSNREEDE